MTLCRPRRSTPSPPGIRSGSDRRLTWWARTRIWRVTRPGGRPVRRWSSTAVTRRLSALAPPARRAFDAAHEDLGERLRHVAGRQPAARLQPEVRVVVHAEPRPRRQPRVQVAELARVEPGLEDGLDLSLVLPAPHAEPVGTFAGERRELVQEDPDVIRVAVDHVEQLLAEHGQLG